MGRKRVLITGGAGFVGSHLADELLEHGYQIRALDNLAAQVHGPDARRPEYLADEVELMEGDVRDRDAVARSLKVWTPFTTSPPPSALARACIRSPNTRA